MPTASSTEPQITDFTQVPGSMSDMDINWLLGIQTDMLPLDQFMLPNIKSIDDRLFNPSGDNDFGFLPNTFP